jgi:hypothetical protein
LGQSSNATCEIAKYGRNEDRQKIYHQQKDDKPYGFLTFTCGDVGPGTPLVSGTSANLSTQGGKIEEADTGDEEALCHKQRKRVFRKRLKLKACHQTVADAEKENMKHRDD